MTSNFLRFYYFCLFAVAFGQGYTFFNHHRVDPEYIWLLGLLPINFFPTIVVSCFIFCGCLLWLLMSMMSTHILFRALSCVFFILLLSLKYSYGKIDHSYHIWALSSFVFLWIDPSQPLLSRKNHLLLRSVQVWLLLQFFSSGLWKLRRSPALFSWESWQQTGLEHLAYGVAENDLPMNEIRTFLLENPNFLVSGFLLALCFQLFCGFGVFFKRVYLTLGLLALLFHMLAGFSLGIWYWGTALAVVFFLILKESMDREEGVAHGF